MSYQFHLMRVPMDRTTDQRPEGKEIGRGAAAKRPPVHVDMLSVLRLLESAGSIAPVR